MCGATYTNYVKVNAVNGTGILVIVGLVGLAIYLALPAARTLLGRPS